MFTLVYRGKEEVFDHDSVSLQQLRERFAIPERKQLYRVDDGGELTALDDRSLKERVRDRDTLEALSDFVLG